MNTERRIPEIGDHPRHRNLPTAFVVVALVLILGVPASMGTASGRQTSIFSGSTAHAPTPHPPISSSLRPSAMGTISPAGVTHSPAAVTQSPAGQGRATHLERPVLPDRYPLLPRHASSGQAAPVFVDSLNRPGSTVGQLFLGPGFQGENDVQCGCSPPDVQVSANSYQVAEMVNLALAVWSTSGVKLTNTSLYTFYGDSPSSAFLSDPRIIFDPDSGRWFSSILEATTTGHTLAFAVSSSSDATGNWTIYRSFAPFGGDLGDQPILGVSHDLLSIGTNDFGSAYDGSQFWVVNKSSVLNGTTASFASFGPDASAFSIHPVRYIQPSNGMFLVETFAGSPGTLEVFSVNGVPPAVPIVRTTNLTIGNLASPLGAVQPGTASKIDDPTAHVQDALWSAGHLWVVSSDECTVGGSNHSCVRVDELNTTGTPSVFQDFDTAVNRTDLFYPSISLDAAGSLVLVFGLSSRSLYPGVAATYRTVNDPLDSMRPGTLIANGTGSLVCGGTCRYGDYFGSGIQPGSLNVWVAGEYITPSTNWQSWVQAVQGFGPMSAAAQLAQPSVDVGQSLAINVTVSNSTCLSGGPARCSLQLPFGDGQSAWVNCSTLTGALSFHHRFSATGTFSVGLGGFVQVFSSGACLGGSANSTLPVAPQSLNVLAAPLVGLAASPSSGIDQDQSVVFNAAVTSGHPPFTFSWSGLPPSCTGTNQSTVSCSPSAAGDYLLGVSATDANGVVVNASLAYRVDPGPSVELVASPSVIELGQSANLIGAAANGSGDYRYTWQGLPAGCGAANTSSLLCTPTDVGAFPVSLSTTDSRGVSSPSDQVVLVVVPALSVTVLGPSGPLAPGDSVTLSSIVVGGGQPYVYDWSGLPPDCAGALQANLTCHPPAGGYSVTVHVHDGLGGSASATFQLTVGSGGLSLSGVTLGIVSVVLVAIVIAVGAIILRWRGRKRAEGMSPRPPPGEG